MALETVKKKPSPGDHSRNLEALLQRCRERNIDLNRDKLKLKRKEGSFIGHILTGVG